MSLHEVSVTPPGLLGETSVTILRSASLVIGKGEWISVIGMNGSGKSTLLKVMSGVPVRGLQGSIQRSNEHNEWMKVIPIVMQQPEAGIIGATPWEDVVAMLESCAVEENIIARKAEEALRSVGLGERMHQPVETLSGGQKQLVAIAACVAASAPLLLLDEITSMLDPMMSKEVLEGVRRLHQKGTTVVWVTQKLEELRPTDRAIMLDGGTVSYDGDANGFFFRHHEGVGRSVAERHGFQPPYSIQVAWELEIAGVKLAEMPFTPEQLAEAVIRHGG